MSNITVLNSDASLDLTTLVNAEGTQTISGVKTFSAIPVISAGGISFPSTQVASSGANILDDYEEGTYSVTLTADVGSGATYTGAHTGNYIKIGRLVFFNGTIGTISSLGTLSGELRVLLPFTVETATPQSGITITSWTTTITPETIVGKTVTGTTYFKLYTHADNGSATGYSTAIAAADVAVGMTLTFSGVFIASA